MNNCPECNAKLILRSGIYGDFYGCTNYPKCKYTEKVSTYLTRPTIKVDDVIVLKYINENKIEEYRLITQTTETIRSFDRFGFGGAIYNEHERVVTGGDPLDKENPSISTKSLLGSKLLGKKIGDYIKYDTQKYLILDIIRNNVSIRE